MINAVLGAAFYYAMSLAFNLVSIAMFRPTRLGWWVLIPAPLSVIWAKTPWKDEK